jgi:hypothetical protein
MVVHLRRLSLGLCCAACAAPSSAFMVPIASLNAAAPPNAALVVFVRESSSCDERGPFRLVDEGLNFLGDSPPASKFAARIAAGHHEFFVWQPSGDLDPVQFPFVNQVGALEGDFAAGRTYYVAVSIANARFAVRKTCNRYEWLALRMVDPTDARVAHVIADAHALVPDASAGQRKVDSDRSDVARHVAMGMLALRRPAEVGAPEEPYTWPSLMP